MQKFFGTAFGLTVKIPKSAFGITQGKTKVHEADNGSGTMLHREFCGTCGSGILERGVSIFVFSWLDSISLDEGLPTLLYDSRGSLGLSYGEYRRGE